MIALHRQSIRSTIRTVTLLAAITSLLLTMVSPFVGTAAAAEGDPPYQADGQALDSEDFANLPDDCGGNNDTQAVGGTKLDTIHQIDPKTGEPQVPVIDEGSVTPKDNLCSFWVDSTVDDSGDVWLYAAFRRETTEGTAHVAIELLNSAADCDVTDYADCNPWENRPDGTRIIGFTWQGNDGLILPTLWTWNGTGFDAGEDLGEIEGAFFGGTGDGGAFGEIAVNLSIADDPPILENANDTDECEQIAGIIPLTLPGLSLGSQPKDVVLGDAPPVKNCGSIVVVKDIVPADGDPSDIETSYATTHFDVWLAGGPKSLATVPGPLTGDSYAGDGVDGSGTPFVFGDDAGEDAFQGDGYTLDETPPTGWMLGEISCTRTKTVDNQVTTVAAGNGSDFTVAAGEITTCVVHNTPDLPTIEITKNVVNDDHGTATAADFTPTLTDGPSTPTLVWDDADSDDSTGTVSVLPGTYTVGETEDASVANAYTQTHLVCTEDVPDGEDTTLVDTTADGATGTVALELGDDVVCAFTNDDDPATLTVVKRVINDNGGTLDAVEFDIAVSDSSDVDQGLSLVADETPDEGYDSQAEDTLANLAADTYTITEADEDGYTWLSTSCVATDTDTEVTAIPDNDGGYDVNLGNGDDVTCTLVNDDDAPGLTVVKQVVNDDGGDAAATAFTVYADDVNDKADDPGTITLSVPGDATDDSVAKTTIEQAGTYAISEASFPNYSLDDLSCVDNNVEEGDDSVGSLKGDTITVTVGLGDSITCTLVNTDDPAQLTVIKNVVNDDGGTASATGFGVGVSGPGDPALALADVETMSGYDDTASDVLTGLSAGTYTIDENDVDGYDWASFGCTDDSILDDEDAFPSSANAESGYDVTLGIGDSVTCWLVNDDMPGSLTLYKKVVNDNGRTAVASDFTPAVNPDPYAESETSFTFNAVGASEPVSYDVPAGDYNVTEAQPPSTYTLTGVACYASQDVTGGVPKEQAEALGSGANSANVTIGNADDVTCIVTNDDVPPPPPDEDPYLLVMGPDAVNPVNTTHTFTATLTYDPGSGFVPAANRTVRFSITGVGTVTDVVTGTVDADGLGGVCTTNTGGQCDITITSTGAGTTTVTATADRPADATASSDLSDEAIKTWVGSPAIDLVKDASTDTAGIGDLVTYTYTITNTGDVPLTDVQLIDEVEVSGIFRDLLELLGFDTTISLDPGESTTITSVHLVTEDDLPGPIDNVATVTGVDPEGTTVSDSDDESVSPFGDPAISLDKVAAIPGSDPDAPIIGVDPEAPGDTTIPYEFTITNTGNVTLTDVTLTDIVLTTIPEGDAPSFAEAQQVDGVVIAIDVASTTLAPGESTTGTLVYQVRAEDVDNSVVVNVAEATGVDPTGTEVAAEDPAFVSLQFPDVEVLPEVIEKPLPATGINTTRWALIAALLAGLGALFLSVTKDATARRRD